MNELKETHQKGFISIENLEVITNEKAIPRSFYVNGDFGIQIARDGRVWICINGIAFLRFKPEKIIHAGTIIDGGWRRPTWS